MTQNLTLWEYSGVWSTIQPRAVSLAEGRRFIKICVTDDDPSFTIDVLDAGRYTIDRGHKA